MNSSFRPAPPLPRVLLAARARPTAAPRSGEGLLLHDLGLGDLIWVAAGAAEPLAVDLDSVEGLEPDEAALRFLSERLGVAIVITKRPALARHALELGCVSLLRIYCLDSTGLERALEAHPGEPVGTAISPGLMVRHLPPAQLRLLPRPLLAWGLLRTDREVKAALAAGADTAVRV